MLKAQILKKLRRRGNWGGCHTAFDDLPKSLPKHLRGEAKEAAEELVLEGLLMTKQTSYGLHVSLNPQRKTEIDKIIKEAPRYFLWVVKWLFVSVSLRLCGWPGRQLSLMLLNKTTEAQRHRDENKPVRQINSV